MARKELFSGTYVCEGCGREFELNRATADELECPCGGELVEVDEDASDDDQESTEQA